MHVLTRSSSTLISALVLAGSTLVTTGCAIDWGSAAPPELDANGPAVERTADVGSEPPPAVSAATDDMPDALPGAAMPRGIDTSTFTRVSATTTCAGMRVSLESDGENCGRCGHSCLDGACSAGRCQARTLVAGAKSLASFAVDDGVVAYADDLGVARLRASGRGADVLFQGTQAFALAAEDGAVFFSDRRGFVGRGGDKRGFNASLGFTSLFTTRVTARALVASRGRLVFVDGGHHEIVVDASASGVGAPRVLAEAASPVLAFAVGADDVFFATEDGAIARASREPGSGRAVAIVAEGEPGVTAIAVTGTYVAWARKDGQLRAASIFTGEAPVTIATLDAAPTALVADAEGLYYAASLANGTTELGLVVNDTTPPEVLARTASDVAQLVTDARAIYWSSADAGSIHRLAK